MLTLKEVKSNLREHGIRPNKRLGQNFLIDKNIQRKIIELSCIEEGDVLLEIGPGLGALTSGLCKAGAKVIAVEKDKALYGFLLKRSPFENLELIHDDILRGDFSKFSSKVKVMGNLPYYISSPILIHLLKNRRFISSIFITVQQEFAERVVARPGTKVYGSISCFVQFYAEPAILLKIKKSAFYPAPKVDSCFLKIDIRNRALYLTDEEKLFKIIRTSFEKRRKTILNCLASSGDFGPKEEISKKLNEAGIFPIRRPETISLKEFVDVAEIL